ncbi:MAG: GcrA family cell cycle regulator [Pseudomonadota bacterium]
MQSNFWTKEREAALYRLWREGYSSRQIAEKIGDLTQSAVIGKAHRLGLSRRSVVVVRKNHANPRPVIHTCQWIEGDPKAPNPHCGAPCVPGYPYCSKHKALAYQHKPDMEKVA